ncbi:MAG: hypothetical protein EBV27_07055, partial [Actinobacteria bacterium]|nr:hypothetical protein [Actinomycetota bacterium]
IRKYVRERNIQKTLDEMSVTGNVAGYNTPAAFAKPGQTAKKNKRLAKIAGGTVVNDLEEGLTSSASAPFSKPSEVAGKNAKLAKLSGATLVGEGEKDWALGDVPASKDEALPIKPTAAKEVDKAKVADISGMIVAENRWLELKREESSPKAKVGKGISNIQRQLSEIEKFVNWYSKIKNENGLKKEDYWKRTNANLYKIRERLMGITEKLRKL